MGKKNEYVFNIGFNKNNPEHKAAADLLNRMGHIKADYIAKAVIFYDKKGSESGSGTMMDYQNLEQMVRKILAETNTVDTRKALEEERVEHGLQRNIRKKERHETELEEEDMPGILKALEGFRK